MTVEGIFGAIKEHDGGTDANRSLFEGERGAVNVLIESMSEGGVEAC